MQTRRDFMRAAGLGSASLLMPLPSPLGLPGQPAGELKLSLAQWSLHRALNAGQLRPLDFPRTALETYGIPAVEYVNQFYADQVRDLAYWKELRRQTDDLGVTNVLIMVDNEGLLGDPDPGKRQEAVDNHMKWAEAAHTLGCHAIRVNAFGSGSREELRANLSDGLGRLAEKATPYEISVLVENHGLHTSDGRFMADLIRGVGHPGLGTLPDFGNWCLNAEWGSTQGGSCTDNYGPENGLADFLPLAMGVSAKSYDFDAQGNETLLPYRQLLQQVKDAGYQGHIGIEYEGNRLGEPEGIRATKALLERLWPTLD